MAEASQQASSFDTILDECLELFVERLRAAMAGMLDKADESLVELTTGTHNREQQQVYQDARKVIAAGLASSDVMSNSRPRRFPVTVTDLPVTRCQICHRTVAYRPGNLSES